jgi:type VI secretion system secreted protein Hcp
MAQVDFFLELDGIKGESADDKHKGTIEVNSFSWGATNSGSNASGGGGGTGKVKYHDLEIVKEVDSASPLLMLACASGQHIPKATLYLRKAGGTQNDYYVVTMTDVLISSYQSGGGALATSRNSESDIDLNQEHGPLPVDQFSLNFAKIKFDYKPQKADGSLDSTISAGWDIKANKKL